MAVIGRSHLFGLFWTSWIVANVKSDAPPLCSPPSLVWLVESENGQVEIPLPEVRPLGAALGAQVLDIDLSQKLSSSQLEILQKAFAEHLVLVFRNQTLTPKQQVAFTEMWGSVEPHPLGSRAGTHPDGVPKEVMVVQNDPTRGVRAVQNDVWHSDLSCMERPPSASFLYALKVPHRFGDTQFANAQLAWNQLSSGMQQMLSSLKGVHNSKVFETSGYKEKFTSVAPDILHPVVRTHPVSGRRSIYISDNFLERFHQMTVEESVPLKKFLISWVSRAEHVYRHQWQESDLVMWDNRATLHYGVYDYGPEQARLMHRTTASGERPY